MCSKATEKTAFFYTRAIGKIAVAALFCAFIANITPDLARAQGPAPAPCPATDAACQLPRLESLTAKITEASWRDQTYRETAKLYMATGDSVRALALLPKIESPDTRALTIRGIGMEAAKLKLDAATRDAIFTALRSEADKIDHPPSLGIALTYIAMAQAFAGDDAGAFATAKSMTNDALRHKAFGESAEIQAERGDLAPALESLAAIDSDSFRNKAHLTVAKIFADKKLYDHAMATAEKINNDYQKSQALLYIMAKQITPEEVTLGIRE